ncbi:MAG: hypothetical protein Q4F65_14705, partial [Propionibacteriaceae bacterium]|nr:hypothetical protein [Propionibacteriaceae bacterium]
ELPAEETAELRADQTAELPVGEPEVADDPDEPEATAATEPTEQASKGPSPLVWVLSALAVVALIAGIVWFAVTSSRAARDGAIKDTATAYLTAIAEGNAAAALETLAEQPSNTTLLTDEVLAASAQAAPLTDIVVDEPVGEDTQVTVTARYALGASPVETTLTLTGDGRREWAIADGTAELAVPERRALTVNGVTLTEETNPVFPGTYTAAPTSDKIALTGEATATVQAPAQEGARIEVAPGLSEAGVQTALDTVKARFDACLGSTDSRPVDCPFGVDTEGVEVGEGGVRFTPTNNPWETFAPTLNPDDLTATGTIPYAVNATATVTRDGLTTEATVPLNGERGYTVDLTQDPAGLTWW